MIVSYGDALIDLYALPLGSDLEQSTSIAPHVGGSTCNVAIHARRLGAEVRFVGTLGDDGWGRRVRSALDSEGIDTSHLHTVSGLRTPVTFVRVHAAGERHFLSYRQASGPLSELVDSVSSSCLARAKWLHVSSSSLHSDAGAKATWRLLEWAQERGVRCSVDLNVRPGLWADAATMRRAVERLASFADLLKASEDDLAALSIARDWDGLAALTSPTGAARAVLTRGAQGAVTRVANQWVDVPAPAVTMIDATGAGDAFVGALLAQLAVATDEDWDNVPWWRTALGCACESGAQAVTHIGASLRHES
ncbi:MAG: carbohydrate kinase [Deltaproteobacteria bacterium]|nr:carbohydrate kinase [Deltaproteobacteria bacterium]